MRRSRFSEQQIIGTAGEAGISDDKNGACMSDRAQAQNDQMITWRGRPAMIVSDNGTELTSNAILRWAEEHGVDWHYIASRQAGAERLRREIHRPVPGRMPE